MLFQVLGPLQVWDGHDWAAVRAPQQRVLLAVLLTEPGRAVSADRLVDAIWGDHPPRTALNTVQGYVVRLRRLLGDNGGARLVTRGAAYQLVVPEGQVDAAVFERCVESAQRELAAGELEAAVGRLAEGLRLWRGQAFQDVPASDALAAEVTRLEQRRVTALELRLGAQVELGRHAEVVDELTRLVQRHPLREGLRALLMTALYRCGRRAEALAVYRAGRALLVSELGVEPGPQLRELERAVLADDLRLLPSRPAARPRAVPAQVPAGVSLFTGRAGQLRLLDRVVGQAHETGAVPIVVITGTPGVGKTALARHWAHRARDRFPDGQLHVDLQGNATAPPTPPLTALSRLLRGLDVPPDRVPTDLEEAAALYRSELAGRRALVVLDDARDLEQVRPLLPGTPGCAVVVTSRGALTGLVARDGAHSVPLDVLTAEEARALLTGLLGARRARAEPEALVRLAELCAHLPLALRIAAANLITNPTGSLTSYTDRLAGNRLAALRVDGDEQTAVRTAFELSHAALGEPTRRLFALLGSFPGADFTAEAAAALSGDPVTEVAGLLDELAAAHMLTRPAPGRYGYHDLLRLFAREQDLPAAERDAAVLRLHRWYLRAVDAAASVLYPQMIRLTLPGRPAPQSVFADHAAASEWLDAERGNLVAAVTHAARHRPLPEAGLLAEALRGYFWLRMHTVDWLAVAHAGLSIGEANQDDRAQAAACLSIADAHHRQGHHRQATEYSTRALEHGGRGGWLEGQAAALGNLGNLARTSGRLVEAAEHHERAFELNRRTGRLTNQFNNLSNLGIVYRHLGRLRQALDKHAQALAINEEIGSRQGEANGLTYLGGVWRDLGELDGAADHLERARALHRELGDRGGEADATGELAAAHHESGRHAEAARLARDALELAREAGYRRGEVDVLVVLGLAHQALGGHAEAIGHLREALATARAASYRFGEVKAMIGLAAARRDLPDAERALAVAVETGYRLLEARARTLCAELHLAAGAVDAAVESASRALDLHREIGHRQGEQATTRLLTRARALTP
ncbi:DNA-binding SARP family transcriptional activator [Saccharothrix coeruleofusca]|uniref:AfsR/SARP family transcriptional regulator n=1 Tax=Saccharothrix coeruleofusca TaxID=33919 RepID=UPI001AEAC861|nr:AfsR/SARP family transcriptional regulator [Saccharothrix coeruleofusca]MBP2336207.1 DNA-binding SARP family transcriptional activator [Saccharothrix coeruleofusca]